MKHSFIEIDVKLVYNACAEGIGEIEKYREELVEKKVKWYMRKFFFPAKSREEAIGRMKKKKEVYGMSITQWDWIHYMTKDYEEDDLTNLMRMCEDKLKIDGPNSTMYLSVKDHKLIRKYL